VSMFSASATGRLPVGLPVRVAAQTIDFIGKPPVLLINMCYSRILMQNVEMKTASTTGSTGSHR
jgi:hypothetical protein